MKINLVEYLIYFLAIIASGYFLIFDISLDIWRTLLTIISFFLIGYGFWKYITKKRKKNYIVFYLFILFLIIGFAILKAKKEYDYSLYECFYSLRQYIWIFCALPIYYTLVNSKNPDRIIIQISNIIIGALVIRTIIWSLNTFFNIQLFHNMLYEYGIVWSRNNFIRMDITPLFGFLFPSLIYLSYKYKNPIYKFWILFLFAYISIITQTRMLILGFIGTIILVFLLEKIKKTNRFFWIIVSILLIIILIGLGFDKFLLNKLNLTESDGSISYRLYEIKYYFSLLANKWFFGLGILTEKNINSRILLYGNLSTKMYLDDLGILSNFIELGIFSFFIYFFIFTYYIYIIKKCRKYNSNYYYVYLVSQLLYLMITGVSLNIFGIQRSFSLAFLLATVGFISKKLDKKID